MPQTSAELLTAHHLPYRVVNVIEEAKEFVVLVTAYLQTWTHLDHAIRSAVDRGVSVTAVLRKPDGDKREQERHRASAADLAKLGVKVHFVPRLHAKAYINEAEAIVTSFNLVDASQDSIELGVLIQDPDLVQDCLRKISAYCPDVGNPHKSRPTHEPSATRPALAIQHPAAAYCIGCAEPLDRDPAKPLCRSCYKSSRRGTDLAAVPRRSCHFCGVQHDASLHRPICIACWKALSQDQLIRLRAVLPHS